MKLADAMKRIEQIQLDDVQRKNDFTVSFCGVFSSGKTSILNYLLDGAGFKLPVGDFPITKVITKIRYGKTLRFYCSEGNTGILQNITRDKFEKMVVGKAPLPFGCTEILVEAPCKILENGVVFIDTPGFLDEMGGKLEQMSREAVLKSDMAVFCTSAAALGHQFEREFIANLDECIGNYCMVINRMDCCNTEEDVENVEKKAAFLMKGKGGKHLWSISEKTHFFTVADGSYKNLQEFISYLGIVLTDMGLRANIKRTSSDKIKQYRYSRLKDEIDLEVMEMQEELDKVSSKHFALLNAIKQEYNLRIAENTEKERAFREKYYAEIDTVTSGICRFVSHLSAKEFSETVHEALSNMYTKVFTKAERELSNIPHTYSTAYRNILSDFKVSDPFPIKTRKLSPIERITNAVSDYGVVLGPLSMLLDADDGWEYGWNDYCSAAIQKIKRELKPKLENEICYLAANASFVDVDSLPEHTEFEGKMKELKSLIRNWKKVQRMCATEE